jgi:hypothetical protein
MAGNCQARQQSRNYRDIAGGVLLMYGAKSDSTAVTLAMERLAARLPHSDTKESPRLDRFFEPIRTETKP